MSATVPEHLARFDEAAQTAVGLNEAAMAILRLCGGLTPEGGMNPLIGINSPTDDGGRVHRWSTELAANGTGSPHANDELRPGAIGFVVPRLGTLVLRQQPDAESLAVPISDVRLVCTATARKGSPHYGGVFTAVFANTDPQYDFVKSDANNIIPALNFVIGSDGRTRDLAWRPSGGNTIDLPEGTVGQLDLFFEGLLEHVQAAAGDQHATGA